MLTAEKPSKGQLTGLWTRAPSCRDREELSVRPSQENPRERGQDGPYTTYVVIVLLEGLAGRGLNDALSQPRLSETSSFRIRFLGSHRATPSHFCQWR